MTAFDEFPPPRPVPAPVHPPAPLPVAPTPLPVVLPPTTNDKAWITGMGGLVASAASYVTAVSAGWPQPWPAVASLVIWAVTTFFTHRTPNKPIAVQPTAAPPQK